MTRVDLYLVTAVDTLSVIKNQMRGGFIMGRSKRHVNIKPHVSPDYDPTDESKYILQGNTNKPSEIPCLNHCFIVIGDLSQTVC